MIQAGDFRNGITIEMDNNIYQIIEFQHVKPGKGAAFVRTKLKNITNGGVVEKSFRPTEKFPQARIERKDMQYLYSDGELYHFMDTETYDQIALNESNTLCFNDSLNEMWIDTITKPSYSHIVKNPEVVQEIFANSTSYSNLYFDDWVSNHTLNITGNSIGFQLGVENSRYAQLQTECSNGYMSGISTISKEKERGVEIVTNAGTPVCWHPDDNSKAGTEINFNVYKNDCIVNSGTISIKYKTIIIKIIINLLFTKKFNQPLL